MAHIGSSLKRWQKAAKAELQQSQLSVTADAG